MATKRLRITMVAAALGLALLAGLPSPQANAAGPCDTQATDAETTTAQTTDADTTGTGAPTQPGNTQKIFSIAFAQSGQGLTIGTSGDDRYTTAALALLGSRPAPQAPVATVLNAAATCEATADAQ